MINDSLTLQLQPGWLKRQADLAEKDMQNWPDWMKQEYLRLLSEEQISADNTSYGNY